MQLTVTLSWLRSDLRTRWVTIWLLASGSLTANGGVLPGISSAGVNEFFGPAATNDWLAGSSSAFRPAAEIVSDGEDAVVRVELPGVDVEKDVTVEVDKGTLVIHGERRDEHTEAQDGRTLREVRYGSFRRAFALPSHVSGDAVTAGYDALVLTERVAGVYAGEPRRIPIAS